MGESTDPASFHVAVDGNVVALDGEVDLAVVAGLRAALERAVAAQPPRDVVVEAGSASFWDTSGLNAMVAAANRLQGGRHVVVRGANARLRRLLALSRVDRVVVVEPEAA